MGPWDSTPPFPPSPPRLRARKRYVQQGIHQHFELVNLAICKSPRTACLHLASRMSPGLVVNPESRFRPRRGSPAFQAAGIGMWTTGFPFFCTVGERGRSRTHISRFLLTKGKKSLAVLFPFFFVFFCFFGLGLFCPFFGQLAICTKKRDAYHNARPAENRTLSLYFVT